MILARINRLEQDSKIDTSMSSANDIRDKMALFYNTSVQIESQLLDWSCGPTADVVMDQVSCAYMYRRASLVLLYRIMLDRFDAGRTNYMDGNTDAKSKINALRAKIRYEVSNILSFASLDPHSEYATVFPLFLARAEAIEKDPVDDVRERLQKMFAKRQFRNIQQVLAFLEKLWKLRQLQSDIKWFQVWHQIDHQVYLA